MAVKWNLEAERELWAAICSPRHWFNEQDETDTHPDSLWCFVQLCWGTEWYFRKRPGEARWLQARVHQPYLRWLQTHLLAWMQGRREGSTDRYYIAVVIPRGFGKTVTASKSGVLWTHLDDPDMSSLFFSAGHDLSKDILGSVEKVLSGEDKDSWFSWLYGNWKVPGRKWNDEFCHDGYRVSTNLSEPSFDTSGVDIGATGYHHDQHCVDDPIVANKLRVGRDAYMRSVHSGVDALFNALKPNGLMMFVLTRYLDDDVMGRHLVNEGVASWNGMKCPNIAIFKKVPMGKGNWHVFFWQTEDEETGQPTLPEVYNLKKIAEHKRRDPEDYACQQQNDPGSGEHTPLRESQIRDLYTDYNDLGFIIPVLTASIHIDTAFKRKDNIGKGDDSAIVVWLHDERPNGLVYLDTDLLRASNEWRAEDFHDELIKVCINLRKRGIRIKCITDEAEGMGKAGTYESQLKAVLNGAGFFIRFHAINRQGTRKRNRIRTAAGYWAEGFVRLLLHKRETVLADSSKTMIWHETDIFREMVNQMVRIDAVPHDDLADAAADVFVEEPRIWTRPVFITTALITEEGRPPVAPGDADLKWFAKKLTDEELLHQLDQGETEYADMMGPGHGWNQETIPIPREPV